MNLNVVKFPEEEGFCKGQGTDGGTEKADAGCDLLDRCLAVRVSFGGVSSQGRFNFVGGGGIPAIEVWEDRGTVARSHDAGFVTVDSKVDPLTLIPKFVAKEPQVDEWRAC